MFQFRAFPSYAYFVQRTIPKYCSGGFPHSEISGSTDICSSPKLIAACHVLRRLLMPRHSPCALYSLTLRDILVLLFGIMQAINRLLSQNCNCYPHLFRCSTIKISQTSFNFCWKTSLLPCFHHFLHCSVFKVQFPVSLETRSKRTTSCPLPSIFNSKLVEIVGIEPATSCLQGRRSPSWAKPPYFHLTIFEVVGQNGLEPSTSRLSVVCSSQLSYWPISAHFFCLGTQFAVPSKLNNAKRFDTLYWP